jgi:hypothetical protein
MVSKDARHIDSVIGSFAFSAASRIGYGLGESQPRLTRRGRKGHLQRGLRVYESQSSSVFPFICPGNLLWRDILHKNLTETFA